MTRAGPESFAAAAIERLVDAGADRQRLVVHASETQVLVGVRDRWVVRLVMDIRGAVLATIDPDTAEWLVRAPAPFDDLDAVLAELAPAVLRAMDQLTVHRLVAGRRYRIARDFADATGAPFVVGEELVFESLHHVPYHDGYTLRFATRSMLLTGDGEAYARFGLLVVAA